eukprot:400207_1
MYISKTGLIKEQCINELKSLNIKFRKVARYTNKVEQKSLFYAGIKKSWPLAMVGGAVSAFIPPIGATIAVVGGIRGLAAMGSTILSNVDSTKLYILFEYGPKCGMFSYGAWYGFKYSNYLRIEFDHQGYSIHIGKTDDYVSKFGKLEGNEKEYEHNCKGNKDGITALISVIDEHDSSYYNEEDEDKSNWYITHMFCALIWNKKHKF